MFIRVRGLITCSTVPFVRLLNVLIYIFVHNIAEQVNGGADFRGGTSTDDFVHQNRKYLLFLASRYLENGKQSKLSVLIN